MTTTATIIQYPLVHEGQYYLFRSDLNYLIPLISLPPAAPSNLPDTPPPSLPSSSPFSSSSSPSFSPSFSSDKLFNITEELHQVIAHAARGDSRNMISKRADQTLFDYCRMFLQNGVCNTDEPETRTTMYQPFDGGVVVYHHGYLYKKRSTRSSGTALLYCQDRDKYRCPAIAELGCDGITLSVRSEHIGHERDADECQKRLCDRIFRERIRIDIDKVNDVVDEFKNL